MPLSGSEHIHCSLSDGMSCTRVMYRKVYVYSVALCGWLKCFLYNVAELII